MTLCLHTIHYLSERVDLKPIRVLLADDCKLIRAGFRAMLNTLGNIEVVAETGHGREALELLCQHRPDVALVDTTTPGLTELEVVTRVTRDLPDVRVINDPFFHLL